MLHKLLSFCKLYEKKAQLSYCYHFVFYISKQLSFVCFLACFLYVENESLGYLPSNSKKEVLHAVIIDLDFLFKEDDTENIARGYRFINLKNYTKYNRRYKIEKSQDEDEAKKMLRN